MYRVILKCSGVPEHTGAAAAIGITEEFTHRPWQRNARCTWDGVVLRLQADNDLDDNGAALTDEFSDAISACIAEGFDGNITVESVTVVPGLTNHSSRRLRRGLTKALGRSDRSPHNTANRTA